MFSLHRLSLAARLKWATALSAVLALLLGLLIQIQDARSSIREESEASLRLASSLIDAAIKIHQDEASTRNWMDSIRQIEHLRHLKITIDTGPITGLIESKPQPFAHPDVPRWFRWAVRGAPMRMERSVLLGPEREVRILLESFQEDELYEAWGETRSLMELLTLLFALIYVLIHVLVMRSLRPVGVLVEGLKHIETGDYSARLPVLKLPELNRLAEGINRLAQSLEKSQGEIRRLSRHQLDIQEEEREWIARELHDEFGQNLTAIRMLSSSLGSESSDRAAISQEIFGITQRLFSVLRQLLRRLRPMVLEDLGLEAAIQEMIQPWAERDDARKVLIALDPQLQAIRGQQALVIYRIVQEAFTNMLRHSHASQFTVLIQHHQGRIHLVLSDNGIGSGPETASEGFGLLGMRERVLDWGGQFQIDSRPGQGFRIEIDLPLKAQSHA